MPITNKDARTLLSHFEGLAESSPQATFARRLGTGGTLTVVKETVGFKYQWGGSDVSKFIALQAVQTFTDAGR